MADATMPIGFLISTLVPAGFTALALWPRPTKGPRATPAFVLETSFNELPFVIVYWLAASTLLAVAQGSIDSPIGWAGVAVALLTAIGVALVVRRATRARPALDGALASGLGIRWRDELDQPLGRELRPNIARWPALIAPVRLPARGVHRMRNIAYGPDGTYQRLDLYRPRSDEQRSPALIYFHPGGFFSGRKSREARPLFDRLVRLGWVCAGANYRLGRGGAFPGNLADAKRAVAWLREHAADYGADPGTIFVAGGSAGAHLAVMCALTPNDPTFQPGFEWADTSVAAAVGLYGYYGPAPTNEPMPSAPADYARPGAPPVLVIHGSRDPMVPPGNAREFVGRLRRVSRSPVVYAELPGAQHNFDRFPSIRFAAVIDAVEAFTAWVRSTR
jgi:acetyl esterase/lipase